MLADGDLVRLAHLTNDTGRPLRSALHSRHKDVAY